MPVEPKTVAVPKTSCLTSGLAEGLGLGEGETSWVVPVFVAEEEGLGERLGLGDAEELAS